MQISMIFSPSVPVRAAMMADPAQLSSADTVDTTQLSSAEMVDATSSKSSVMKDKPSELAEKVETSALLHICWHA